MTIVDAPRIVESGLIGAVKAICIHVDNKQNNIWHSFGPGWTFETVWRLGRVCSPRPRNIFLFRFVSCFSLKDYTLFSSECYALYCLQFFTNIYDQIMLVCEGNAIVSI